MDNTGAHPGLILKHDFLEHYGISQVELSEHLGISFQRVNEIVNGRRGITPDTAKLLAQAFKTSPDLWMILQAAYDLKAHEEPVKKIKAMI